MSRKRRTPDGKHKMRKGPTAIHGGTIGTPMVMIGHFPNARKPKQAKKPQFSTPLTIAELWGNDAPEGEMSERRTKRKKKILGREKQSMKDKAAYIQAKTRAAVA